MSATTPGGARALAAWARERWVMGSTLAVILVAMVVGGLLLHLADRSLIATLKGEEDQVMLKAYLLGAVALLFAIDTPPLCAQAPDTTRVRQVVEAVGQFTQAKSIAGLDTLFAPDAWVRVIEGAGVNNGWVDYREHHLRPELEGMGTFVYRFFDVEPHVRGDVAWAAFKYELTMDGAQGHAEIEGRGTAVLERRGTRWQIVQLHTSGRRRQPGH